MQRDSSTQNLVMNLMRQHGSMTAGQLADRLGISKVAVRRHLAHLESEGLAIANALRQKKGRPTLAYTLTDRASDQSPDSYKLLATQLLDAAHATMGEGFVSSLFAVRMDQLLNQLRPRMLGKSLAERVAELAQIQEEGGYMADWQALPNGYVIREQNCAIYRIARRYRQACSFELELFRRLLGVPVTRIKDRLQGEMTCAYWVSERTTDPSAMDLDK